MIRTGRAGTSRGDRLAKWLAANTAPLAFVASAFGCGLMLDPRSTQCSSDRQCAALVGNGQEARCEAGYCKLLGGGSSVGGAAGTANAGRQGGRAGEADAGDTDDGSAGSSGSGAVTGAAGTNTEIGGESGGAGEGAGGGSTAAGGLAAGGSLGGTAGSTAGGTEGTAGAPASTGGSGGTGGSFGGSAGNANSGGNGASGGGTGTIAEGVMVLTVPLTALGEGQRYNSQTRTTLTPYDLAGATLTLRAFAPEATGGNLHIYLTSSNFVDSTATDIALSRLADGFQNIDIPVPQSATGGFEPGRILVIRVEVEAGAGFGASWRVPATHVYVDSITSSNGVINDTFSTAPASSTFGLSDTRVVPNSTLTWLRSTPPP